MQERRSCQKEQIAAAYINVASTATALVRAIRSEQAASTRKEGDCHWDCKGFWIFLFNKSKYLGVAEMSKQCQYCRTMCKNIEKIGSWPEKGRQLLDFCKNKGYLFPLLADPPPSLQQLLTSSKTRNGWLRQKYWKIYNTVLSMVAVTATWVNRGQGSSSTRQTITSQREIYHFNSAPMPAAQPWPAFVSLYISYSDYGTQIQHRNKSVRKLDIHLIQHLTEMLLRVNPYGQR